MDTDEDSGADTHMQHGQVIRQNNYTHLLQIEMGLLHGVDRFLRIVLLTTFPLIT